MHRVKSGEDIFSSGTMRQGASRVLIDEILNSLNILSILENEYNLVLEETNTGWFKANCPLPGHRDSDPSFGVNPEMGKFRCLGCGRAGDAISFIRLMDGTTFAETLERLRIMAGIDASDDDLALVRLMREINDVTDEFLNRQAETKLPGGMSMIQFHRSFAERLRNFEIRVQFDVDEVAWVDSIYMQMDDLSDKEEEAQLTKLWNQLGNQISTHISAWRLENEDECNE